MDIKKLKGSLQLAQLRAKSNPSEENVAILQEAQSAYDFALDPEKKTEDELPETPPVKPVTPPKPATQPKPATKPIANNPLKKTATVPAAPQGRTLTEGEKPQTQEQQEETKTTDPEKTES